jgi:hypothetical protein
MMSPLKKMLYHWDTEFTENEKNLKTLLICTNSILSIIRGKKPGFSQKPGFSLVEPQVIEKIHQYSSALRVLATRRSPVSVVKTAFLQKSQ